MKFRMKKIALKVRCQEMLYGGTNSRAIDNFPISGISMNFPFTNTFISMLVIKDAARANKNLATRQKQRVISRAAEVWTNKHKEFPMMFFKLALGQAQT